MCLSMNDHNEPEDETLSDYKVMHTPAGYYVGIEYWDAEMQSWFPWDRCTHYMDKAEAERTCEQMLADC